MKCIVTSGALRVLVEGFWGARTLSLSFGEVVTVTFGTGGVRVRRGMVYRDRKIFFGEGACYLEKYVYSEASK